MATVEFTHNGIKTDIQCQENDKMEDIINNFCIKSEIKKDGLYFIYGGNLVNESNSFIKLANSLDIERKKISILVYENEPIPEENNLKKSKYIICPECNENIRINVKNFRIELFDCPNGHSKGNLSISDLEKSQMIDESKIKCNICNNTNKTKTFGNSFFVCFSCKKNICPLCKDNHEKSHIVIDYSQKDFKCKLHNEYNSLYCNDCKKDICILCEKDHINHKKISLGEIMPDKTKLEEDKNSLRKNIDEFIEEIQDMINVFNNIIRNIEGYYNIFDDIVNGYEIQNRNYFMLQNINDLNKFNNDLIERFKKIKDKESINSKFEEIMKIWSDINFSKDFKELDKRMNNNKFESLKPKSLTKEEDDDLLNSIHRNLESANLNLMILKKIKEQGNMLDEIIGKEFDIGKIKKLKTFSRSSPKDVEKVIYLQDEKFLMFENGSLIIYDFEKKNAIFTNFTEISDVIKLIDGKLIITEKSQEIKLLKIKENDIEINQEIKIEIPCGKICVLSNSKILIFSKNQPFIYFYTYNGTKITYDNYFINTKKYGIDNICEIDDKEIAISCYERGRIFGYNQFIIFYNLEKKEEIKSIDIDLGGKLCLLNKSDLIVLSRTKIYAISLDDYKIFTKYSWKNPKNNDFSILKINKSDFLVVASNVYHYKLYGSKIFYEGSNLFNVKIAEKLHGHKLFIAGLSGLDIYEY